MENRFGFKDLVFTVLLLVIAISIWLAMKQADRQHAMMDAMKEQVQQLTSSQARMERVMNQLLEVVESGVVVSADPARNRPEQMEADPFERVKAAKVKPDYSLGDWCVDAFGATVSRITPLVSTDVYASVVQSYVLQTLATRDPDTLKWSPLLSKSWQISDDGLTITFQLRRGITFSDGEPLTSEDVIFTWDMINNEMLEAPRVRNYYDKIESVIATDEYEVIFSYKEPYFESFEMAASMEILPSHFYSGFSSEQINRRPGLLLGSGPYRLPSATNWSPGDQLVLVRNERYWGESPAFDRLIYREILQDVARLTTFRNGDIDVFSAQPEQYVKMIEDEELLSQTQHYEYESPRSGYGFIAWNQMRNGKPTVFSDRRVRRAMTHMINRKRISDELLYGYGIIPTGPFNRLSNQYDQSVEPIPYDIDQALKLLEEEGYRSDEGDRLLKDASGNPLQFKLTYPATQGGGGFWDKVMLLIKDDFARAGVVMELDSLEWAVFKEKLQNRDFDAISLAWSGGVETDVRQMFHSSQIAEGADNFIHYVNPEVDRLIDLARSTVDEEKRMPLWRQVHRLLHEDQPYTFLYSRKSLMFLDDRIHNVQRVKLGLNDRDEWYVPGPLQLRGR